jgi:hypothetical protein
VYADGLGNDFLVDDEIIVASNVRLAPGEGPLAIFRRPEQFADFTLPYYRPLTNLTYWIDSRLWGLRPGGFHLTSWLLHGGNTLLCFEVVRGVTGQAVPAAIAALLFAAHPIHSESVDMVQGRTDLLAALFVLLGLLAVRRALGAATSGGSVLAGAGALAAFAAALLCKETAATWPLLAAGLIWADPAFRRRAGRWGPLLGGSLLLLAGYLWLRQAVVGQAVPIGTGSLDAERVGLAAVTLSAYLQLLVWPFDFTFVRTLPAVGSLGEPRVLGALGLAAALLAGLFVLARRHRQAALGAAWIAIPLLPVLNLFPIPGFTLAERYLYLPSLGFCLLAALPLDWALHESRRPALRGGGLALLLALLLLFALTIQGRTAVWADPIRTFEAMAEASPASFFVQSKLGLEYQRAGRPEEAVTALRRARDLSPDNPVAWNNLGVALLATGRLPEARDCYRRAVALRPDYAKAHQNLAAVLAALGDTAGAQAALARAQALTGQSKSK